ncbi:glycoside hydrolase family 3 protein [Candidatus Bathyarchaeota archaeon]|nr:glycoside hydrolase family 3 protein [Candidatus Bathyarchaeota archaeon]
MKIDEEPPFPFQDVNLSFEERVEDLLSRIDDDEKIVHLTFSSIGMEDLGIPPYDWWNECLHGVARAGIATVFPQAIGMAAMFDPTFLFEIATAISDEARAKHHDFQRKQDYGRYKGLTFWSPNINIFRDPRWGRGQETYGEDPYLTGRLGVAFVKGLQGDHQRYLKLVATPKHYAAHSGPEALRHEFNARVSKKDLRETYLPHFKECIVEGGAYSIMGAYNRTNGEACCASPTLLKEILRDEWGFDGYVVSDCGAINDIHDGHGLTGSPAESAALAVKNGCDLDCGLTFWHLEEALEQGLIDGATIDLSLKRLLMAWFKLGRFDPPNLVPYQNIKMDVVDCPRHREIALKAARRSIVLLKNENGILPISPDVKSIAVIGPNAADPEVLLGNYNGIPSRVITPLAGIKKRCEGHVQVTHVKGSGISEPMDSGIEEAVQLASDVDMVIACMGISNEIEGEEQEDGLDDREHLGLPHAQDELLRSLQATGKPIILVLLNGGPISVPWAAESIDGILEAWYPGQDGGTAIADVLFGDFSPCGKLPITIVRSENDLPPFEEYSMNGRTYRYLKKEELYPFGYGLSYTDFDYSGLRINKTEVPAGEPVLIKISMENCGSREGADVVQVYLEDEEASTTGPRWSLVGFRRVSLVPGERIDLEFTISPRQMSVITQDGTCIVEPGSFTVHAGGQQPGPRSQALTGKTVLSRAFKVTGETLQVNY